MRNVFLSYRRSDSRYMTGRLYDRMAVEFGGDHVFRDTDSIPLAVDFRQVIEEELARCDVFVTMVGPRWLDAADADGNRRLDDPEDFVRVEIEAALARGGPILVARVDDTAMPPRDRLPQSLARLVTFPDLPLRSDPMFHSDATRMIEAVRSSQATGSLTLTSREIWSQAIDMAFGRCLVAEASGLIVGGLLSTGLWQLESVNTIMLRGQYENSPFFAVFFVPGVVGGAVVGLRRLGWTGVPVGAVGGFVLSIPLTVSYAIACMCSGFPPVALVDLDYTGLVRLTSVPRMEFFKGELLDFFASGPLALALGLFVARSLGRRRAQRERVRWIKSKVLCGAVVGSWLVSLVLIAPLIVVAWLLQAPRSECVILLGWVGPYTAFVFGLLAAVDALIGAWQHRARGPTWAGDGA
jgi:hypothetical protein